MRNGDVIDELVEEVCIARLSEPDIVDLLSPARDEVDIRLLHARREKLVGQRATIAHMVTRGMPEAEALEALDHVIASLGVVDMQIAAAVELDPLTEVVGVQDVRAWWNGASLARRRGVVERLMTVVIHPVGKGRRITTIEAAAETVSFEPKV